MLATLGNGEELRHLNSQEDWLKTAVVSKSRILSTTNADGTIYYVQTLCQYLCYDIMSDKIALKVYVYRKIRKVYSCNKISSINHV